MTNSRHFIRQSTKEGRVCAFNLIEKLDKAGLVGKNRLQGKNDYGQGGIWYALKMKYCLTLIKIGNLQEHKCFKGFTNLSDKLDRKNF